MALQLTIFDHPLSTKFRGNGQNIESVSLGFGGFGEVRKIVKKWIKVKYGGTVKEKLNKM